MGTCSTCELLLKGADVLTLGLAHIAVLPLSLLSLYLQRASLSMPTVVWPSATKSRKLAEKAEDMPTWYLNWKGVIIM